MKKSLISVFIIIAFFINILSLSFLKDKVYDIVKYSSIEQILFALKTPTDILSKCLDASTKEHSTTTSKTNKQTEQNKIINVIDYILVTTSVIKTNTLSNPFKTIISNILSINIENNDIQYPLKIPFLRCIYLLLLMTLLFSVLPRSISINYNKNIERACIV